jgi:hypothetical protein
LSDLRTNSSQLGGSVIEATDTQTIIPVVLMKERVTNGALKLYDEFAPHAHWFEGVPIIPPHKPGDPPVNHLTQKAGKIRNVRLNAEKRRVEAEAIIFNDRIAPGDLEKIKAGEPFGGSIGYYCNDEALPEPLVWADGTEYKSIERGPFFADHFSMVPVGACPLPECGFNVNTALERDDSMNEEVKKEPEIKANAEAKPEIKVEPPVVNVENKIDLSAVMTKLDAIGGEVATLKANIDAKDAEIAALKAAEELRANAAKEQADQAAKAGFRSLLKLNFQNDLDKLYAEYAVNPVVWVITNREKIDLTEKATIDPIGQAFVPHVNSADEDVELAGLMPSDEDIAKKVR